MATTKQSRAQGCLLGQIAGDSLGSLVEFETDKVIKLRYPNGLRDLANGGTWNLIAGQPTDDSELALILARTLIKDGKYKAENVLQAYRYWLASMPFDCGKTTEEGLNGTPILDSEANGALMRISPLGILGSNYPTETVWQWAETDSALTHQHPVPKAASALFACGIAYAVASGDKPKGVYERIKKMAIIKQVPDSILQAIKAAEQSLPADYLTQQGWVLIALQNALWQLLHAPNLEEGIVDTVMRGGDTDTNAAIAGALLGAVYGIEELPVRWLSVIENCRPEAGAPNVRHPRPKSFWPVDAMALASALLRPATEKA